jgi:FixJ family two-component response regulator
MARSQKARARPVVSAKTTKAAVRNVVLVDDDSLERTALARLLRGAGYNVTAFERPSDVLVSVLPDKNSCLVLDIYMPEMNGIGLWRELRSRGFAVPTILITGHLGQQTKMYGEEIGAVAVLYKPVEEKELFEAIEKALAPSGGA